MTRVTERAEVVRPSGAPAALLRLSLGLGLLVAGVLVGTPAVGWAAGSAPTVAATAKACTHPSVPRQIRHADVVFRGVVQKVRRAHGSGVHRIRTYKVKADRVYKASLAVDSVVVTAEVGARCPPPTLSRGRRYIFFVTEQGSRLVSTADTARATRRLTRAVVARLGNGVQPHPRPPAGAQLTKVADASPPPLSRLLAPGAALVVVSLLGLVFVGRSSRRTP